MSLSRRARSLSASLTLEITAEVARLRRQGVDVISLGAGEPDFPSPPEAVAAARDFIAQGRVAYTASSGLPELRAAAGKLLSASTGVPYAADQVVVTCGAKEGIALAILACAQAGDEVLVPTPAWISYGPLATIADASLVEVACPSETGWKLTAEALAGALTERTRALILNTPNNPTGAVYSRDELAALAAVLEGTEVAVISDEIYWPFVYEGRHVSPASLPGMADRTIVVNGVSKSHSMTGWRIGFVGAPPHVAGAIANLKSHLTSNAATPSQHAALAALQAGDAWTERMAEAFRRRRRLALEALQRMPGVEVDPPGGAFYVCPRVDGFYSEAVPGSGAFCRRLLDEQRVAAVPGAAFGEDRFVRLSIATAEDKLAEALERLGVFLQTLAPATSAPRASS